jgi:protein-S-isoprenylcysteine O-methyltransferase Ste14
MLPWIPSTIMTASLVSQIVLLFVFRYVNPRALRSVTYCGYAIWALSAIFGVLPVVTFRVKGQVQQGMSYMHTTALVDSGIYAIVRHPQYLAGVLLSVAMTLASQTWVFAILSVSVLVTTWVDAARADRQCIQKFGDDYRQYMRRVPQLNALGGMARLAQHTRQR